MPANDLPIFFGGKPSENSLSFCPLSAVLRTPEIMSQFAADLHIHSRFCGASSLQMSVPSLLLWAPRKGIDLLGTGDFMHPGWMSELSEHLDQEDTGLLKPKDGSPTRFLLTAELAAIFPVEGRAAEIRLLVTAPNFAAIERLLEQLSPLTDPSAETIPSFQMQAAELVERILNASPQSFVIPVHLWSPSSAVYGSRFGFHSFQDCFAGFASEIHALETGLSSDPGMLWRVSDLDGKNFLSSSGAHEVRGLGREFTLFEGELSYLGLGQALKSLPGTTLKGTVEQVSELGAHFFNGHRECQIAKSPIETDFEGRRCPACRKELTIGSFQRTLEISDRSLENLDITEERGWIRSRLLNAPAFRRSIPLPLIIAATYGIRCRESQTVDRLYETALSSGLTERQILLDLNEADLQPILGQQVTEGILRVREGSFRIAPGYDGVCGQLEIFEEQETAELLQLKLF
jgi:PHP family Zn ribbon phosphoesterase